MSSLGQRLSVLRKQANMTQAALGEELNISAQAVSKWEKGLSEPDVDTLIRICDLFNVSIASLVGKEESSKIIKETEDVKKDVQEDKIPQAPIKVVIGRCSKCGKEITDKEKYYVKHLQNSVQKRYVCSACEKKAKVSKCTTRLETIKRELKKGFISGGLIAAIFIIVGISLLSKGFPESIASLFFIAAYSAVSFMSQIQWGDKVFKIFKFFIRTVRMPGIIFDLSIDGIIWAICVKIMLSILSVVLSLILVVVGFIISNIASWFIFPFALASKIMEIKRLKSEISMCYSSR